MTNQALANIKRMYDAISQRFYGKPVNYEEMKGNPVAHCEADLEAIMFYANNTDMTHDELARLILSDCYCAEARNQGMKMLADGWRAVIIRQDWYTAIKFAKKGTDLSVRIRWSFFQEDFKELARLHKANRGRKKIEALLEDCNFHKECADFAAKEYAKYL